MAPVLSRGRLKGSFYARRPIRPLLSWKSRAVIIYKGYRGPYFLHRQTRYFRPYLLLNQVETAM